MLNNPLLTDRQQPLWHPTGRGRSSLLSQSGAEDSCQRVDWGGTGNEERQEEEKEEEGEPLFMPVQRKERQRRGQL